MENAQELIQRLNHSGKKLSKSHRRIAECIVTHYDKVVFMTASKLGEYVGVSESTVVRFANEMGFDGYPGLQAKIRETVRVKLTTVQRMQAVNFRMDEDEILDHVLLTDAEKIKATLETIDRSSFERAADVILRQRTFTFSGCVPRRRSRNL